MVEAAGVGEGGPWAGRGYGMSFAMIQRGTGS